MSTVTADIVPSVRGGPVSLDGYAAGPNQSADLPFGEGVDGRLHTWMFDHAEDNRDEIDGIVNAGAYIMGRNMFGARARRVGFRVEGMVGIRAALSRAGIRADPPSPGPARDGRRHDIHVRDRRARVRACAGQAGRGGRRVAIAGGAATLNQYLSLGAIDELRLHVVPITLGAEERVFDGVTGLTFDIGHVRPTEHVLHVTLRPSGR